MTSYMSSLGGNNIICDLEVKETFCSAIMMKNWQQSTKGGGGGGVCRFDSKIQNHQFWKTSCAWGAVNSYMNCLGR